MCSSDLRMRTERVRNMSLSGNLQELLSKSDTIVGILKAQKQVLDDVQALKDQADDAVENAENALADAEEKLATAKTVDQIDRLLEEIVDRFGKLPPQAQTLIDVHRLRVLARPYGVVKVDAVPTMIHITFKPNPPIEPLAIIQLVQKNKHIKLAGNDKLRIEKAFVEVKDRAQMVRDVLKSLGTPRVTEPA